MPGLTIIDPCDATEIEQAVPAIADHPGPVVADAQAHLVGWYEALGFVITGPEYLEDDIAHVPMRREP